MILDKFIEIKTTNKNITYYKNLGYDIKSGDIIKIPPFHLPNACKLKINVKCDICNNIKILSYHSYTRNIEKYGYYACTIKCSLEKRKQTNIDTYGVEYYTQTPEYIIKTKNTKKEKYGDENYVNIEKQKQTNKKRFNKESYMSTDIFKVKKIESMIKKYGVKHALQNNEIKEKWIQTNIDRYQSKCPLSNNNVKNKIKKTKLLKYNDECYNNRNKYKNTILEIYGVDNPMKDDGVKKKLLKTIIAKYGVNHHMHIPEIVNKVFKNGLKIKNYKNTNLYYQGSYEYDFLEKYYNIINIERGKSIKYMYNNNLHIYYPDFYLPELNLIVEIKSTKWYNEHLEKNIEKKKATIKSGYNFLFIIDKEYNTFEKLIQYKKYSSEDKCYQRYIKDNTTDEFNVKLSVSDFEFKYIDKSDKKSCNDIVSFIKTYEWLGKMPNRPTHRFVAMYKGKIGATIVMSIPNSFSKILGENTKDIERLISRGASASWTPTNIGSSLIMWSIKWMVNNTLYRLFSAYSDPEAKELGTIYQACNFTYIGQNYGSDLLYFDLDNPDIGWTNGRNYRKVSFFKKICKENNIIWKDNWFKKYTMLWDNIPTEISSLLLLESKNRINNSIKRIPIKKHKYIYILGKDKKETKYLKKIFNELNPRLLNLNYPKERGK